MIELTKEHGVYDTYKVKLFEKKMSSGFSRFSAVRDEDKEEFFNMLKIDFNRFYEIYEQDSSFKDEGNERSNFIFHAVLGCESYNEFYWTVKHYDSEKQISRLKQKRYNIRNEINELTAYNNTIKSTKGWRYTKPLRLVKMVRR